MRQQSKTRYAFNNMIAAVAVQIVTFITGLIVPRLILLYYGSEINGLSSSINQFISYAALLEAGLGLASIQALYNPLAKKDYDEVSGICSSTRKFYNRIGFYFIAIIIAFAIIYPFLAKGQLDKITIISLTIVISLSSLVEYFFHAKYRVLLTADQKLYIVNMTLIVGMICSTVIKCILIVLYVNIVIIFLISSIILLCRSIFISWYVKRNYKEVNYNAMPINKALYQRSALVMHQIAGLIVNNTGAVLLSMVSNSGLKLASVYAIYSLVYKNLYIFIIAAFSNGVVAGFGQISGNENHDLFIKRYRQYEFLYYMINGIIYSTTAVMILPFIHLYTSGVTDVEYYSVGIAIMFTLSEMMNSSRVPGGMLIDAKGHFHQTKYRALIEAAINLFVTVAFINLLGIYAVLMGACFSYFYRSIDIIVYTNRNILMQSASKTFAKILTSWSIVIITTIIFKFLLPLNISRWLDWIISGTIVFVFSLCITIFINYITRRNDFIEIIDLLKIFIKQKNNREIN